MTIRRMTRPRLAGLVGGLLIVVVLIAGGGASAKHAADAASGDWTNFGNTVDENRYSPLTQITPGNVDAARPRRSRST